MRMQVVSMYICGRSGEEIMRKTVLVFGLISGTIIAVLVWLMIAIDSGGEFVSLDYSQFIGYGIMIVALSMIFFGIKSFRDNYNGGKITFWKGVQIGLLITAMASAMYGGAWLIHNALNPGWLGAFMQRYTEYQATKMRESGSSEAEVATASKQMEEMGEMIKNPLIFFLLALVEIAPVGLILTLICAAILRKPEVLPAHG